MYTVNFWGSDPAEENDDLAYGEDFETLEEAEAYFSAKPEFNCAFVELDGPEINKIRRNPNYTPEDHSDRDWSREYAIQAGMAFGCQGYNDAMGY